MKSIVFGVFEDLKFKILEGFMQILVRAFWKEYLPNLLETTLLPGSFVFEVRYLRSSPWTPFWPRVLNLNSDWTCTVVKWVIITDLWQLYYYCKSQKVVIISPFTTSKLVIQLPQISYYAPINHCSGQFWVEIQNHCSKPGLWWRSEISNNKNKKSGQ